MYTQNSSSSFWNYWVREPLAWIIESGSRPSAVKKYLETLTPSEATKSRLRIFLIISGLSFIIISALNGLLLSIGVNHNLLWSLSIALIISLLLPYISKKAPLGVNYIAFLKLITISALSLVILIELAIDFKKVSSKEAFIGLILLGMFYGIGTSVNENNVTRGLNFFTSTMMCFTFSIGMFHAATNSTILNFVLFYAGYTVSFFQLPGSVFTYHSLRQANLRSMAEPHHSVEFLRQTLIYRNETITVGSRGLEKLLRRAAFYDWPNARQELGWMIAERPAYANLARRILVEHIVQEMKERKTLLDIAGTRDRMDFLLPDETIIKNEVIEWTMRALCDIGDSARLYCAQFGLQNDPAKLHRIAFILKTALEKMPQDKTKLTKELKELKKLLEYWSQVNSIELQKVTGRVWQTI